MNALEYFNYYFFLQKFFIWLFLPYVFTPFNDKRRTKKISVEDMKKIRLSLKKSLFICSFEIVLYKDLVSGPTKETGIDRAASYLMLNLRKP